MRFAFLICLIVANVFQCLLSQGADVTYNGCQSQVEGVDSMCSSSSAGEPFAATAEYCCQYWYIALQQRQTILLALTVEVTCHLIG